MSIVKRVLVEMKKRGRDLLEFSAPRRRRKGRHPSQHHKFLKEQLHIFISK